MTAQVWIANTFFRSNNMWKYCINYYTLTKCATCTKSKIPLSFFPPWFVKADDLWPPTCHPSSLPGKSVCSALLHIPVTAPHKPPPNKIAHRSAHGKACGISIGIQRTWGQGGPSCWSIIRSLGHHAICHLRCWENNRINSRGWICCFRWWITGDNIALATVLGLSHTIRVCSTSYIHSKPDCLFPLLADCHCKHPPIAQTDGRVNERLYFSPLQPIQVCAQTW